MEDARDRSLAKLAFLPAGILKRVINPLARIVPDEENCFYDTVILLLSLLLPLL